MFSDPDTFWLMVVNVVLGTFVLVCLIVVGIGIACQFLMRVQRRHARFKEIEHDLGEFFGTLPGQPSGRTRAHPRTHWPHRLRWGH